MDYKTQVFTEQQLKDLVEGKVVVTTEPVKKGEQMVIPKSFIEQKPSASNGWNDYSKAELSNAIVGEKFGIADTNEELIKYIAEVGELVQAVNEKGEKKRYCKACNKMTFDTTNYCIRWHSDWHHPLLVRLEKIEKKENFDVSLDIGYTCPRKASIINLEGSLLDYDEEIEPKLFVNGKERELPFNVEANDVVAVIEKSNWLKTWRRVE